MGVAAGLARRSTGGAFVTAEKLKLYDFLESGNGYKVRLLLAQLAIPFERI